MCTAVGRTFFERMHVFELATVTFARSRRTSAVPGMGAIRITLFRREEAQVAFGGS